MNAVRQAGYVCSHQFEDEAYRHNFLIGRQARSPIVEPLDGRNPIQTRTMHPDRHYRCKNCGMTLAT